MEFTSKGVYHAHPIDLYISMDEKFGKLGKWLEWEPEVFLSYFPEVTYRVPKDKLLAVQSVAANMQLPYTDHTAFEAVGNCFCNYYFIVGESSPLGTAECFYVVAQLKKLAVAVHGVKEADLLFYGEIPSYIAATAKYEHQRMLPSPLSFGQSILDYLYPNYEKDLSAERDIVSQIDKSEIPNSTEDLNKLLDNVDPSSTHGAFISWLLSCYFYDPTAFDIDSFEDN